jgi:hypothetical protein
MEPRTKVLLEMLTYRRKGGSKAEAKFINRYLRPLGVTFDTYGNVIKRIGTAPVLWSSHTDTVHRKAGRQRLEISPQGWVTTSSGDCLGADCAAGVWLMREMILAGVEGLYVFHRDEEMGGGGSAHIAGSTPELLEGINYAIAFDRMGFSSVITHQFGERCCSPEFATALAKGLGDTWELDDGGTFTDTANYTHLIPECTNISVGYLDQHRASERLHIGFLHRLLGDILSLNAPDLPVSRDPEERDTAGAEFDRYYADWTRARYGTEANDWYGDETPHKVTDGERDHGRTSKQVRHDDLLHMVRLHPHAVVAFLDAFGVTADELMEYETNKG